MAAPRPDAALALRHPDGLDLRPQRASPGQARQERQLHGADDLAAVFGDDEQVRRISVDAPERGSVGGQVRRVPDAVSG